MRDRRPRAAPRHRAPPPEERSLTDPRYIGSFPRADALLDPQLPEVAFVGRSNVGKSTLLNALVGRRIAKVSATPGKTRTLNVFQVNLPNALYFLDLPGYGYARASQGERSAFRRLVRHALVREGLRGVVWLLDLRHAPSADDGTMQDLLAERGTRVLAALTKADKLPRRQRQVREQELRAALALPEDQIVVTSARTGEGVEDLREAIEGLIKGTGE
ncbi:MAG TPA: ribosome biogenesis GTP-binding protein YihA/YsxC [Gemmatimonadales bacterium]|nr:ribosome biogenesis GTP-binding protein YihA/YsxC [Gemmatimonadales bacterium]